MSIVDLCLQECVADLRQLADSIEAGTIVVHEAGSRIHATRDEQGRRMKGRLATFSVLYEAKDE